MALRNLFGTVAGDDTAQTMLEILTQILGRLPLLDGSDRSRVFVESSNTIGVTFSGVPITAVSSTTDHLYPMGGNLMNAEALQNYNRITVT